MLRAVFLLLLSASLCGPALGAVQRLSCTRLSGARIHDLTLVIDDGAKMLDVEQVGWLTPADDIADVTFKGDTISWFYMRGTADLDRKTGVLDWDDGGEYDYLQEIGQADPTDSDANYRGRMQCKVAAAH